MAAIQNNGVAKTVEVGSGRVMVRYRSLGGERGGGTESSASASLQVFFYFYFFFFYWGSMGNKMK